MWVLLLAACEPTFHGDVAPILGDSCGSCHYTEPGGLALWGDDRTYGQLVHVPSTELPTMDRVTPGDLDDSYLWRKLEGTHLEAGGSGDAMPLDDELEEPLDDSDRDVIARWIEAGAPR